VDNNNTITKTIRDTEDTDIENLKASLGITTSPKRKKYQSNKKFTVQILNSYAPLDPNTNISPDHYKQVIKERREQTQSKSGITEKDKTPSKSVDNTKENKGENNSQVANHKPTQLSKLTLRQYINTHKELGLNKNMPFLTSKSKQLPLMKQLVENEKKQTVLESSKIT
jgi:hypothetical protein